LQHLHVELIFEISFGWRLSLHAKAAELAQQATAALALMAYLTIQKAASRGLALSAEMPVRHVSSRTQDFALFAHVLPGPNRAGAS
jgi:hypothetical protein